MKISVYIDGFNLYYGRLKKTQYKWLDFYKMCTLLFPNDEIVSVKYFTAAIKVRNEDDQIKTVRQQLYWRALRTLPKVEIIEGIFLQHKVFMKAVKDNSYVRVFKSEEKGTGVNIASHLVNDAHNKLYEKAVVISNDSDLVTPIRIVTTELNIPVITVSPFDKNNLQLKSVSSGVKQIRKGLLGVSQFDDTVNDEIGEFTIPEDWKGDIIVNS
jgi:uncharacterized LabA/DUF88 family protein